jgi:hypothetical protein
MISRRILPWRTAVSLAAMTPKCLFDLRASWHDPKPASGCPLSKPSGKVPDTHSVGSISDQDFGVFTVPNIATENTDTASPAHPVSRMPKAANQGLPPTGRECGALSERRRGWASPAYYSKRDVPSSVRFSAEVRS